MTNSNNEEKALRWRCRRGMRELDIVCEHYLDVYYSAANDDDKATFRELLDTEDPVIYAWLTGRSEPDSAAMKALLPKLAIS